MEKCKFCLGEKFVKNEADVDAIIQTHLIQGERVVCLLLTGSE
jgi:(2Fe-2S) ferredoxin